MTTITPVSEIESTVRFLDELIGSPPLERVSFQLWSGRHWPDDAPRAATIVLRHPGALRAMFSPGTEKALAEAYLRDDFDIVGDAEAACELADRLDGRRHDRLALVGTMLRFARLPRPAAGAAAPRSYRNARGARHSPARDRRVVSFHYDLSNDFFQLWLDPRMQYSCAYFESHDTDLATAQTAKLRHLCRKLRLRPGQRLLDIGCGWGGLAIYAAQHCGAHVQGVTLSQNQAALASQRVREAGLGAQVAIALEDYREHRPVEPYDAIVSVGMSEHVGGERLGEYFRTAAQMLKPGGVFLNHAIGDGIRARDRARRAREPSFIEEYVFPDSDIPPIHQVAAAAEAAGLEVRDVENLREHYALTLRHWVRRLEANRDRALALVDEPTYRIWRLYMAGSAHGFAQGRIAVYQLLLSKPDPGGAAHLPLTRRDWYEP